jgi:type IV pilus assembly protein PilE
MALLPSSRRRATAARGFTLIELMIVVALIGILAALALPSFLDSIRKGRRSDAYAALSAVQQAQERWRSNKGEYTTALTAAPTDDPPGLNLSATSAKGYYTIAVDAAGATGYTVTATAVSGTTQASDGNCSRLRVRVDRGNIVYGSAGGGGSFDEAIGNRCWAQ